MATTLTPAQQEALQGFLDYTKAKNSESTPATTSQTQGVASLASTPASTSQTQGVASLASTPATTSQTQGIASLNTQPWWVGQFASEADANYVDTNRNQKIEDTEKAAWRSRYDPNSTEYKTRVADSQAASTSNNATTKSTTTGNVQPNWERRIATKYAEVPGGLQPYEEHSFINPVTGEAIDGYTYFATANTPEAIEYRNYESAPRTSSGVALSTIKDQFSAIYNDKTLTSPQKAVKIQQLANDNKYSNADFAKALGVTEDVLGTFFSQQQPNWEQDFTGRGVIRYINPVTGEKVLSDVYLETANTPEAIKYRTDNASFLNFDKKSGLYGRDSVQKVWNAVDSYIDPISNKDYTENLKWYLAKQLTDRGITDLGQIEKKVTPEGKTKYYNVKTGEDFDPLLFDDKAGTKYIVTSNGIQKQFDPYTRVTVQASQYISPNSSGGAWGHFGTQGMLNQIGQRVRNLTGVDDINDLELKTVTKPRGVAVNADGSGRFYVREGDESRYLTDEEVKTIRSEDYISGDNMAGTNFYAEVTLPTKGVYNKKTGDFIPMERAGWSEPFISLGGWGEGKGMTYAYLKFDANGKPVIETWGKDSSDMGIIQPIMTLASIIPSPIQPFAIAANAAYAASEGNFIPAIMSVVGASGILDSVAGTASNVAGPAGELASNSGIAGLAQDLGVSADLANKIGKIGASSGLSGVVSAAQGKGFDTGFTSGIASGLIKEGVNELSAAAGVDKGLGSLAAPTKSLVSSALTSAALDRPFDFSEAAKTAATRYGVGEISKLAGLTPEQGRAVNSFLEYLGKKK